MPLIASAQAYFGHLSYQQVLRAMPAYSQAQQDLEKLRLQYQAEAQRGEDEFQKKFVDFLQGQKEFPTTILQKRQTELQTLMDNGVEFRRQMNNLLAQAEKDLMAPVMDSLDTAIKQVAEQRGMHFVLNTDEHATPFINSTVGEDITLPVLVALGLAEAPTEGDTTTGAQAEDTTSQNTEANTTIQPTEEGQPTE